VRPRWKKTFQEIVRDLARMATAIQRVSPHLRLLPDLHNHSDSDSDRGVGPVNVPERYDDRIHAPPIRLVEMLRFEGGDSPFIGVTGRLGDLPPRIPASNGESRLDSQQNVDYFSNESKTKHQQTRSEVPQTVNETDAVHPSQPIDDGGDRIVSPTERTGIAPSVELTPSMVEPVTSNVSRHEIWSDPQNSGAAPLSVHSADSQMEEPVRPVPGISPNDTNLRETPITEMAIQGLTVRVAQLETAQFIRGRL